MFEKEQKVKLVESPESIPNTLKIAIEKLDSFGIVTNENMGDYANVLFENYGTTIQIHRNDLVAYNV